MTTLTELLADVRFYLADATTWPDATLTGYIQDAVRFYSVEFPRRQWRALSLTTGTQRYTLPSDLREVLKVEYPAGEDPAEYLDRVPWGSAAIGYGEDVYGVRGVEYSDTDGQVEIMFGPTVATGESANVHYLGLHAVPSSGSDVLTIPDEHLEAIHAFVDFRAHWQLEAGEAVSVTNSSIVLSQLGENARRAWNRYKEITARLQEMSTASPAASMAWLGRERIY